MYPYLIRIGGLSLPAYPMLYGSGIAVAGIIAIWLGKREGIDPRKLAHVLLIMAISILLGGRLMYVLIYSSEFQGRWSEAFNLARGGQVHYGGVILAVIGGIYAIKKMRLSLSRMTDVLAVGAPLGVAVGRLGCFCRGCCFGRQTDLPWAVQFPPFIDLHGNVIGSPAFLHHVETAGLAKSAPCSFPVHPSQLYSIAVALLLFAIMLTIWKSGRFRGRLMLVYLFLYTIARFSIEFTRVNVTA